MFVFRGDLGRLDILALVESLDIFHELNHRLTGFHLEHSPKIRCGRVDVDAPQNFQQIGRPVLLIKLPDSRHERLQRL